MSARLRDEPQTRRQKFPRPSSSGPGRRPFTAKTGVRFPLGAPMKSMSYDIRRGDCPRFGQYAKRGAAPPQRLDFKVGPWEKLDEKKRA
jgi:hypothetical protein